MLSIEQVNEQYDGEWVFLINCSTDEDGNVLGGEVVIHSKSRDEVFRGMQKYKKVDTLFSIRYAGRLPEGVEVVL